MFDSESFTEKMLSHPEQLSSVIIDALEATDTGKLVTVSDPNNGFVIQMIANTHIFSKFSERLDTIDSNFYPQRASDAAQLFPHLSEFDYVKLMAAPATLPFVFSMSRAWIVQNSVYYDANYNKIEIPATSYITMGGVVYSMYYPIEILVNRNTGVVTAYYDGSAKNNLSVLETNILLDTQSFTRSGIDYFQITFNMYQFERRTQGLSFSVSSEQGFIKTLSYSDQFYALKVLTLNKNNEWVDINVNLTSLYYDYQTPTALLTLLSDKSQIRVEIPQIYFDNGQISQNIKLELYTTKGFVNYSLSVGDVRSLQANFDTRSSSFAAPLDQMPTYNLIPDVTEVSGGSDPMSYEDIRDAVVKQRLSERVAITTPEIIEAGKRAGFDLTRITDDLTERTYFASNILVDGKNMAIPTFSGNILISDNALTGDPDTIINYSDGYYTVLPTTLFNIAQNGLTCTPLSDAQVDAFKAMTTKQMVDELNKGVYVRQPFHITLLTNKKSPQAAIYNLLSPSMTSLSFIRENTHSAPQLSVTACQINHLNSGTGGYQILLLMGRSSNILEVPPVNLRVFLKCTTKNDTDAYFEAIYNSTNSDDQDIWIVQLSTSYHISTDDYFTVRALNNNGQMGDVDISLNQTFKVVTSFDISVEPTVPVDVSLNSLLPPSLRASTIAMMEQSMTLSFGHNLSSQIYCGVNTSWGNDVYELADETIYYENHAPIFQRDEKGLINYRVNQDTDGVEVKTIYPSGSVPSDDRDLIIGVTADVNPLVNGPKKSVYTVDNPQGILVGMQVRGTNVPVGSVVDSVNGNLVTLSTPVVKKVDKGTSLTFTNTPSLLRTTIDQPSISKSLTVSSTKDLLVGQRVVGFDIPSDVVITNINGDTSFDISSNTLKPVKANTLLTIINTTAPGVTKVKKGEIVLDGTGSPIIVKRAQNRYMIPAILFDGRLFASQNIEDQDIISTISKRLQNYANQISTIDAGLIEDSNVFYKPARTIGHATYGIGAGKTIKLKLELSFSVTVYVDVSVYNTQTLLSTMTDAIVSIINDALRTSPIISLSAITKTITDKLGSNVAAVEMNDISGIEGLRLISLKDYGTTPSIENILTIEADGSISRNPNISVTYLPKPDTAEVNTIATL